MNSKETKIFKEMVTMLSENRKEGRIRADEAIHKWREEWRISQSPAGHAYLAAIGMSESIRQLKRFHESLSDNLRLLRKDFDFVKEIWRKCFPSRVGVAWREEVQIKILETIGRKSIGMKKIDCCDHYIHEIFYASRKKDYWRFPDYDNKGDSVFNPGSGNEFAVEIFGSYKCAPVKFYLSPDKECLLVVFVFNGDDMTASIANHIIDSLPLYHVMQFGMMGKISGRPLNISFEFKSDELRDYIVCDSQCQLYRATPEFLTKAADFLRGNGIPVEGYLA